MFAGGCRFVGSVLLLDGIGAGCIPMCWFTAVWFTYGVGGTLGCGARGNGMCVGLLLVCTDPWGIVYPHGMDPLLLDDCGRGESSSKFSDELRSD